MRAELRKRVLQRALKIVGGRSALRARLGVADHSLEFWLTGRASVPDRVLDIAVDLVLEDDVARAAQDRRADPRGALAARDTEKQTDRSGVG
jgi:DNA-binding transcriptional regulator YdaS (Cro superfamily)